MARKPAQGNARMHCCRRARRSEEHTSELQSHVNLVCRLLLEKKKRITISTINLTFIYQCYGNSRVLHSFPTRRSSDLETESDQSNGDGYSSHADLSQVSVFQLGSPWNGQWLENRLKEMLECIAAAEPGDRKSTRLNSSHMSISYAVFCLKKKKE